MKLVLKIATTAISALCATTALSADYTIKRSLELPYPAVEIWNLIGDFCDVDDWHPSINACSLKVDEGSLVRLITTNDGDVITQKRIAEEPSLSYTYRTVSSSLPVESFTATLSIEPFEKPLIMWSASFSSDDPATEQAVVTEMEAGLAAIETILSAR
ncbi:SRPBCC family protein [Roseovarius sp. 2305UL8-3]|uniref:SRPBCC family protein n=1 Tax=Roseovarius conchicola TaxID=3121636 RepID=UPI003529768B